MISFKLTMESPKKKKKRKLSQDWLTFSEKLDDMLIEFIGKEHAAGCIAVNKMLQEEGLQIVLGNLKLSDFKASGIVLNR